MILGDLQNYMDRAENVPEQDTILLQNIKIQYFQKRWEPHVLQKQVRYMTSKLYVLYPYLSKQPLAALSTLAVTCRPWKR